MRRQRAVGWLCLGTLALIFATYGAMALGGAEWAGTLYAAEHQTVLVAGVLGFLLALVLIAASSGRSASCAGLPWDSPQSRWQPRPSTSQHRT